MKNDVPDTNQVALKGIANLPSTGLRGFGSIPTAEFESECPSTTVPSISTQKIPSGTAVKFPFAMKDHFKKAFPSATWNSSQKTWEVGTRSEKRLAQWIMAARPVADAVVDAEQAAFTEGEISAIRQQLATFRTELESARGEERGFVRLQEILGTERSKIADARSAATAARLVAEASKAAALAMLTGIVDLDLVTQQQKIMARNHNPANGRCKDVFEDARLIVAAQHRLLKAAGFKSRGLAQIAGANINRPDRDNVSWVTEAMILDIESLTPVPVSQPTQMIAVVTNEPG